MKYSINLSIVSLLFLLSSQSFACGFCSGKKPPLSGGNLALEPGATNSAINQGNPSNYNGNNQIRQSGSFTYDLKNYNANGQPSQDPNWTSEIK